MELIHVVDISIKMIDGPHQGDFVFQKRSANDKTYQYVCQAAWAGKMELGETQMDAVKRECQEELGDEFYHSYDFTRLTYMGDEENKLPEKHYIIHHYYGKATQDLLQKVKIHTEAEPEFLFVNKDTAVFPLSAGKDPKNNIVIFDNYYRMLQKLFTHGN